MAREPAWNHHPGYPEDRLARIEQEVREIHRDVKRLTELTRRLLLNSRPDNVTGGTVKRIL
jgi:hypothetical protein